MGVRSTISVKGVAGFLASWWASSSWRCNTYRGCHAPPGSTIRFIDLQVHSWPKGGILSGRRLGFRKDATNAEPNVILSWLTPNAPVYIPRTWMLFLHSRGLMSTHERQQWDNYLLCQLGIAEVSYLERGCCSTSWWHLQSKSPHSGNSNQHKIQGWVSGQNPHPWFRPSPGVSPELTYILGTRESPCPWTPWVQQFNIKPIILLIRAQS